MIITEYSSSGDISDISLKVNKITFYDIQDSLKKGWSDFMAKPSHLAFLCIIYPIFGFIIIRMSSHLDLIPLIYPLLTGVALIGPFAALGLYEISRRRELGEEPHWRHAFHVLKSPSFGAVVALGAVLLFTFFFWLISALAIYRWSIGALNPQTIWELLKLVVSTTEGWTLILIGNGVGFLFAAFVLSISIVSFPMLLDRGGTLYTAVHASLAAVKRNPVLIMFWGLLIVLGITIGLATFLFGLMITLPVMGHASWHLYRHLIG